MWTYIKIMNWLSKKIIWKRIDHYPRPVLAFGYCRCLRLCVSQSVCQSLACPCDNLRPVQARITKFETQVQKTLVKIPIVLGGD